MAHFLQNIMTGAVEEFSTWGEAFDEQVRRNVREHWSLFTSRPADIDPQSNEPFVVDAIEGPGISTFERMDIIEREIGRQKLAQLDASLSAIAGADDITRFLNAAE